MGNSLPMTSKELLAHDVDHFRSGCGSMQGYRSEMEDALLAISPLDGPNPNNNKYWMVGVFDGHCGADVSRDLARDLHPLLSASEEDLNEQLIRDKLMEYDAGLIESQSKEPNHTAQPGSTCVFALVKQVSESPDLEFEVMAVNIGDSRIILIRPDGTFVPLTNDHKPDDPEEEARIVNAGGHVQESRVDGQLALSRAFGDVSYKLHPTLPQEKQRVIAMADCMKAKAKPGDMLLVACDGIFEACTNEEVVEFLHERRAVQSNLPELCEDLLDFCLISGSKDNMSCQLLTFEEEKVDTAVTKEVLKPGVYFENSSNSFAPMFRKECAVMGLNPDDVKAKALVVEASSVSISDLKEYLEQAKSASSLPLTRQTDECSLVVLPRPVEPFPIEVEAEPSFTQMDIIEMISALRSSSNPNAINVLMRRFMPGDADCEDDEDGLDDEDFGFPDHHVVEDYEEEDEHEEGNQDAAEDEDDQQPAVDSSKIEEIM